MITLLRYILLINLTVLGLCQGLLLAAVPGLLIVVTLLLRGTGSRCAGISSCGAWASFPWGMWNLSKPGMESVSPALAGWFYLSTVPPGKYQCSVFFFKAHRLRCSVACGILLDQGLNPCLLHWQADSSPVSHQGSPPSVVSSDRKMEMRSVLRIVPLAKP